MINNSPAESHEVIDRSVSGGIRLMRKRTCRLLAIVVAMVAAFGIAACSEEPRKNAEAAGEPGMARDAAGKDESAEGQAEPASPEREGEHGGSEGEGQHGEDGEEGEESGVYIGPEDTWDATRNGARLVLSFDPASNAFVGTVENTTRQTLCAVRVEVHLSPCTELGPTERTDLSPGKTTVVELPTARAVFDTWTAHPEVSPCSGV